MILLATDDAMSQNRPGGNFPAGQQPQQPTAADVKGKIVDMNPNTGIISMLDAQEQLYMVKVDPKHTSIVVQGTADASYLRPGVFVRFETELDKKGAGTADVTAFELYTPKEEFEVGIASKEIGQTSGPVIVAGQIRGLKKKKLTVLAGNDQVTVTVSEEPEVKINTRDLSMVRPLDEIWVKGRYAAQGGILADSIKVDLQPPDENAPDSKKKRSRSRDKLSKSK